MLHKVNVKIVNYSVIYIFKMDFLAEVVYEPAYMVREHGHTAAPLKDPLGDITTRGRSLVQMFKNPMILNI